MLQQQLQTELKESMLARDELRTSVLRMLISAIRYYQIGKSGDRNEASDEIVMNVIQSEAKKRNDAITLYTEANRPELAEKEEAELKILQKYLPEQLSEEEIRKFIDEAISQTGASSPADMGKLMGSLMPKVKGKADGGLVSRLVKEKLQ